jgi:hypothetical protein
MGLTVSLTVFNTGFSLGHGQLMVLTWPRLASFWLLCLAVRYQRELGAFP